MKSNLTLKQLRPNPLLQFTLHVGPPAGRNNINPQDYMGVCTRVGALIEDFSIVRAERCNRAHFQDSLIIHAPTQHAYKILEVAASILGFLGQDSINIAHNGLTLQIDHSSDPDEALEAFGLLNQHPNFT